MKILISRTDNIGDVVLTLPMAGIIKKYYPECKIYFLARNYVKAVVDACPFIDGFLDWDSLSKFDTMTLTQAIKTFEFTHIFHVFPKKRIAKIAARISIPHRIGTTRRWYHWLYCNKLISFSRKKSDLHEAQLNLKLLKALNIPGEYTTNQLIPFLNLKISNESKLEVQNFLVPDKFNLVLHPGSNGNGREWPVTSFAQLIAELPKDKFNIMVTGSASENIRFYDSLIKPNPEVQNLMGKITLSELLALLSITDAIVVGSTGPLHMAAALGIHTLGLFPPLEGIGPERWGPIGKNAEFIVAPTPCENCENKALCTCMQRIEPASVKEKLMQWQIEKLQSPQASQTMKQEAACLA